MTNIFISHSHKNKEISDQIANDLKAFGYSVWLDTNEFRVGDKVHHRIEKGIQEINCFLVVLSKDSVNSEWVNLEIAKALKSEKDIHVLPILHEDCEIPSILSNYSYADFTKDYESGFHSILLSLDNWEGIQWTFDETAKYASNNLKGALLKNRNYASFAIDEAYSFFYTDNYDHISTDSIKIKIPEWARQLNSSNLSDPSKPELLSTLPDYFGEIADYLKDRISNNQTVKESRCKVGIIGIEKPNKRVNKPLTLTIAPLSYWIIEEFNRRILKDPKDRILQQFYIKNIDLLTKSNHSHDIEYICPSALYVEIALITSDEMICVFEKNPILSVLGETGRGKWTCTLEEGLEWNRDVSFDKNEIDLKSVIFHGLNAELEIKREEVVFYKFNTVSLESSHLNTGITGFCKLSLTSNELIPRIKKSQDFLKYKFYSIKDIEKEFFNSDLFVKWHPTARLRMHAVKDFYSNQ